MADDEQADTRVHGGLFKAVLLFASEDSAWWARELGRPVPPGFWGENLTTTGLDLRALRVNDALHAGTVVLRVTQPRTPCFKLAARVGIVGFERRFTEAGRTGCYCSVVQPGYVRRGDALHVVAADEAGNTMAACVAQRAARAGRHG